jgi:methionyl-tRNA formyltransferase
MRVVFMGTPEWAAAYLDAIEQCGGDTVLVVTQPARRRGRGRKLGATGVKQAAMALGLDVAEPEKVNDAETVARIAELEPDFFLVVAYGQILGEQLLRLPRVEALNVHYSLLPALRGPAPVQHALLQGLTRTGVSLQKMVAEVDAGDVFAQEEVEIAEDDNADTLCGKLTDAGTRLVAEGLPRIAAGELGGEVQEHSRAGYAPVLEKNDLRLDFSASAVDIRNRIRALAEKPGAYCMLDGRRLKVTRAEVVEDIAGQEGEPGRVVEIRSEVGPVVATGDGFLLIERVQPEGRREMEAADWLLGARLQSGTKLDDYVDK